MKLLDVARSAERECWSKIEIGRLNSNDSGLATQWLTCTKLVKHYTYILYPSKDEMLLPRLILGACTVAND